MMKEFILLRAHTLLSILILLLVAACARNPVTGKQEFMLVSEDQEVAMGQQSKASAIAQYGIYDNEQLQQYLREKGQAIARISHRPNLNWEFYVMDSPVVNAFAAPGGFVFFTRGILAHFNNEAQLMGVMGHEIGHVTARHSAGQLSKQQLTQLGMVAGMVISPELAQMGDMLGQSAQLLFLKFSRDDETQSDRLGVEYSTRLNYDAAEMAEFFNTLHRQSNGGSTIPSFFSTHPDPVDRNQNVKRLAQEWQQKLNIPDAQLNIGRNEYLRLIDGIVYGEDPRQGYFDKNRFYHPELKFQFPIPSDWKKQNTPARVLMVNQDQSAGIFLQLAESKTSPRDAAQQAVSNYQLTVQESNERTVNGLPAFYVVGDIQEQNGQVLRLLIYEIKYGDLIYEFIGFAAQSAFGNYARTFQQVMDGFDRLSDPSRINVQAKRLRVKTVPKVMTFAEAMRYFNMPNDQYQELAILNGMEMETRLTDGMLIKVVE